MRSMAIKLDYDAAAKKAEKTAEVAEVAEETVASADAE